MATKTKSRRKTQRRSIVHKDVKYTSVDAALEAKVPAHAVAEAFRVSHAAVQVRRAELGITNANDPMPRWYAARFAREKEDAKS